MSIDELDICDQGQGQIYYEASASGPHHLRGPTKILTGFESGHFYCIRNL